MRWMSFEDLAASLLALPRRHAVRLIAIDGGAGAGKTTFAAELSHALGRAVGSASRAVPIVELDDFLAVDDLTEFWPRFEAQVLEPLLRGRPARFQRRDWIHSRYGRGLGEWRELPVCETLVIEGVGANRRALAPFLAQSVWIDVPADVRRQRGMRRDGDSAELWRAFQDLEQAFFATERCRERADVVVDGTRPYGGSPLGFVIDASAT